MAHLVLHIGTHKTATTAIQTTLARSRAALAARGIVYPSFPPSGAHHALAAKWMENLESYGRAHDVEGFWTEVLPEHARGSETVILSSEEFSRKAPYRVDFTEIEALTRGFARRTVVCLLRNQLNYIQSVYMEMQRVRRLPEFPAYVQQCIRANHASGLFLDYGALYTHLRKGFSREEILFLSYEALAGAPGSVTAALFDRLGLDPEVLKAEEESRSNVSPDPLAAWIANWISAPEVADAALIRRVGAALAERHPGMRSTMFSTREEQLVRAHFAPQNTAFLAAYRAPELEIPPLEFREGTLRRDQISQAALLDLARTLYRTEQAKV